MEYQQRSNGVTPFMLGLVALFVLMASCMMGVVVLREATTPKPVKRESSVSAVVDCYGPSEAACDNVASSVAAGVNAQTDAQTSSNTWSNAGSATLMIPLWGVMCLLAIGCVAGAWFVLRVVSAARRTSN